MNQDRAVQSNTVMSYQDVDPGQYIVSLRESVGWSQAELARKTGVDPADLSKMEHNQRKVSSLWLIVFMEAVRIEKDRLRRDYEFASDQQKRIYEQHAIGLVHDLERLGMSESKLEGVRETMSGLIKSVFAE